MDTSNVNPIVLEILKKLFNPSTPSFGQAPPEPIDPMRLQKEIARQSGANPQPGWLDIVWQAMKNAAPPLNLADMISVQRRKPGELPFSFEFEKDPNAPPQAQEKPPGQLPEWLLPVKQEPTPVPPPVQKPVPKGPVTTGPAVPSMPYPINDQDIYEYPTSPMYSSGEPTTPEAPAAAPKAPAEEVDFEKMVSPWQSKINYEQELMDIFNESWPEYSELPQSAYKHPETPKEYLTEFIRLTGWALNGKDPYTLVKGEEAQAEAKAKEERDYVIKRGAQLANMRLSALAGKVKQEETARADQAGWLEWVGTAQPEVKKQPWYQAAVASIRGIPPEQAARVLNDLVDKNTGKLEGMYVSEIDRAINKQEALNNYQFQTLKKMGYSDQRAAFAVATGSHDMEAFLMHQFQTAKTPQEKAGAQKAIQEYRSVKDTSQIKALNFILNKEKYRPLFSSEESFNLYNDWAHATYLLGENAPKPAVPREVIVKEKIAKEMWAALGNPAKEKKFAEDHGGITAKQVFDLYMRPKDAKDKEKAVAPPGMPEPLASIYEMTGIKADKLVNITGDDPFGQALKQAARDMYTRKYAGLFAKVNSLLPSNAPLTVEEMDKLATAARISVEQTIAAEHEIYAARGVPKKAR